MLENKLSSWKEIASYLKRDVRTVRRWEQEKGLPVRRVGGSKGASVYAYPKEIDDWLQRGGNDADIKKTLTNTIQASDTNSIGDEPEALNGNTLAGAPSALPNWFLRIWRWRYYLLGSVVIIIFTIFVSWRFLSGSSQSVLGKSSESTASLKADFTVSNVSDPNEKIDETRTRLKTLVKQSQIFEMLKLDAAPWECDVKNLQFWEPGSKAIFDTVEGASRFNERGIHYGSDARLLDFEFRHVWISPDGLSAEVGTREHWWLPLYKRDGTAVSSPSPDQGPYEIVYFLDKIKDHWYLKSTSTPYPPWKPKQITCKNWPQ